MEEQALETKYFDWKGWDQHDAMFFAFYDVVFKQDFGVFKKGEKFKSISLSYDKGFIEAYNEEGTEVVKFQNFELKPVVE